MMIMIKMIIMIKMNDNYQDTINNYSDKPWLLIILILIIPLKWSLILRWMIIIIMIKMNDDYDQDDYYDQDEW